MTDRPRYTDEVMAALRERAASRPPEDAAVPDAPPPGRLRYHIAVETLQVSGVDTPESVAATLRFIAHQITQKENTE